MVGSPTAFDLSSSQMTYLDFVQNEARREGGDFVHDSPMSPATGRRASFYMVPVDTVRATSIVMFCDLLK